VLAHHPKWVILTGRTEATGGVAHPMRVTRFGGGQGFCRSRPRRVAAEQNERDYQSLNAAVKSGKLEARI
jgi:hypothetical protein